MTREFSQKGADPFRLSRAPEWGAAYRADRSPSHGPRPAGATRAEPAAAPCVVVPFRQRA
jgi:hypothetical protein